MQYLIHPIENIYSSQASQLKNKKLGGDITGLFDATAHRGYTLAILWQPCMEQHASFSRMMRFGVFEVDLKACELRKHGLRLKLSEQPYQVLVILLEKPGDIVTRDELRSRLWPQDTFVDFDHGLNNAVMRLREVLGDSCDSPRFIETLPRKGYRFIAPIEEIGASASAVPDLTGSQGAANSMPREFGYSADMSAQPVKSRGNLGRWLTLPRIAVLCAAALAVAAIFSGITLHYVRGMEAAKSSGTHNLSLVVLPLENVSGDKEQDYFADGMTDDLTANLAKIRSLRVISRSTAMAYQGTNKPLSEIARELHVDAVVEGTVLRAGNRVRITAELVQVSTDHHLWADTYESQLGDVLTLQNRVTSAIVNEIRINLTPEDKERLAKKPAINPEAYEDYLKGRYYWNKRSDEGFNKAIGYFQEATRIDPQYALAYAGLADCYGIVGATIFGNSPTFEVAPKAKSAATRALELDPTLGEAETSLATINFNYDWDWTAAADGFKRAIEMNPSYATAYQRYSLYLIAMGRFEDSFEQINKARDLDPLSISINSSLGWRFYFARQYDRAIDQLRNTLDMDPSYELPHLYLGQAYEQKGEYQLAIRELRKAADIAHDTPLMISALARAYALSGNKQEAETLLAGLIAESKHKYVSPFYVAIVYAGLGREELAMDWLEKAYAERSNGLVFIRVDPELDTLRSNPRFVALQAKMGLPD